MNKYIILAFWLFSYNLFGQTNQAPFFEIHSPLMGIQKYEASQYIDMNPGFSYEANEFDDEFTASISPYLIFPPETGELGGPSQGDDGVVGTINGNAFNSGNGQAIYTIPIEVPSGLAGMTPRISLVYNSQGGNDILGKGWSINGLSSISRTGTNYYHENFIDGIDFDLNDKFQLDNNRLIPISGGTEYRTAYETFSKIIPVDVLNGQPTWFEVFLKNGLINEYGKSEDSRTQPTGRSDVISWQISKTYDRKGNYINYIYIEENGISRISEIKYGSNGNDSAYFTVKFNYEIRPDIINYYLYGSVFEQTNRLKSVEVKYFDEVISTYEFDYFENTTTSFLQNITLFGKGKTEKFNPTRFEWSTVSNNLLTFSPTNIHDLNSADITTGDFNGDGKTDIVAAFYELIDDEKEYTDWAVYYAVGAEGETFNKVVIGTLPSTGFDHFLSLDYNADGIDDIIMITKLHFFYSKSTGTGFTNFTLIDICEDVENHIEFSAGDFNGNGVSDLMLIESAENSSNTDYTIKIYEFYSDAYFIPLLWDEALNEPGYHFSNTINDLSIKPGDFNADGKTELLIETAYNIGYVYELNILNRSLIPLYDQSYQLPVRTIGRLMGDFNADGITDLAKFDQNTEEITVNVLNGKNGYVTLETDIEIPISTATVQYTDYQNYMVSDYNGDGYSDILLIYSKMTRSHASDPWEFEGIIWDVYYSKGTSFIKESVLQEGPLICDPFLLDNRYSHCDFNGDSKIDGVIFFDEDSNVTYTFSFHKNDMPPLISKITNGLGHQTMFAYKPLTDNSVYTKATLNYPQTKNIQPSRFVVASISESDGFGGYFVTNYKYEGARVHLKGKGFLGFDKRTEINNSTGLKTISYSELDATYYINNSNKTEVFLNDLLLNRLNSQTQVHDFGDKRIFIYSSLNQINEYSTGDLNSSFVKTSRIEYTYSENDILYGNITTVGKFTDSRNLDISIPASNFSHSQITNFTYDYTKINEWLFRRSSAVVTMKSPDDNNNYTTSVINEYYPFGDSRYPLLKQVSLTPNNSATYNIVKIFDYDNFGNVIKETRSVPNFLEQPIQDLITEYQYSEVYQNRLVTQKKVLVEDTPFIEKYTYEPATGNLKRLTDLNNLVTENFYDNFNRLYKSILPDGKISYTALRWSDTNQDEPDFSAYYIWSNVSGLLGSSSFFTNSNQLLREMCLNFKGDETIYKDYGYYSQDETNHGNTKFETDQYFKTQSELPVKTSYTYYQTGQIKSKSNTQFDFRYGYDGLGFTSLNLATGESVTKTLNADGSLKSITDAGGTINYLYNSSGQKIQVSYLSNLPYTINYFYNQAGLLDSVQDPDLGNKKVIVDPLNNLICQKDSRNNVINMTYDCLGRIETETIKQDTQMQEIIEYQYDQQNALGQLKSVNHSNGTYISYQYDNLSRITNKTVGVDANSYNFEYEYDCYSNVKKETWPSGYSVVYQYLNGSQVEIKDGHTYKSIWKITEMNPMNQITQSKFGNELVTSKAFDDYGFPSSIKTGSFQNLSYSFNPSTGNLAWRKDLKDEQNPNDDLTETFGYSDNSQFKSRLIDWNVNNRLEFGVSYSDNGNILSKSDIGALYQYNESGFANSQNAVTSISNPTPEYLNHAVPQEIVYNAYNKAVHINNQNNSLDILYGPLKSRIKSILKNSSDEVVKTKYFINDDFEIEINKDSAEKQIHYLFSPDGLIAINEIQNGINELNYIHTDYQGTIESVSDESGQLVEKLSFDPFGRRRNAEDWTFNNMPASYRFDRGYTGHEHLDEFGLINMNGRFYDPYVARFLSPDPFIQNQTSSQDYNRYSYVLNNPLIYTDPSGYNYKPDDWEFKIPGAPLFGPGITGSLTDWSVHDRYYFWATAYYNKDENGERVTNTSYEEYMSTGIYILNNDNVYVSQLVNGADFSKTSDSQKIAIIFNSIKNAVRDNQKNIDLRKIFSNVPDYTITTDLFGKVKISNIEISVHINMVIFRNGLMDPYPKRMGQTDKFNGYERNGIVKTGYWNMMEFNKFEQDIPILMIQFDCDADFLFDFLYND